MQQVFRKFIRQFKKISLFICVAWLSFFFIATLWGGIGIARAYLAFQQQDIVGIASSFGSLRPTWFFYKILTFGVCGGLCKELDFASLISEKMADNARAGMKHYYVWFQNDRELRATGGFLGSYARLDLREGKFDNLLVQDIYVPDGQVKGYVEAPYGLKKFADQGGGWKLRDANWDPYFPRSVESVNWFLEEADLPPADGVIAINFGYIEALWDILGSVNVPDVGVLDRTRLYPYLQSEIEENFFPGSTKKTDLMGAITRGFLRAVRDASISEKISLTNRAFSGLSRKDVLLWAKDPNTQTSILKAGWGGTLQNVVSNDEQDFIDYLSLNESNLGVNKANCCVERVVEYQVQFQPDGLVNSTLFLDYKNNNPEKPQRPMHYGGRYLNYLRVFRDINWQFVSGQSDADAAPNQKFFINQHPDLGLREIAGVLEIEGTKRKQYLWTFARRTNLDFAKKWTYTLRLQKQSGSHTPKFILRVIYPPDLTIEQSTYPGYIDGGTWSSELTLDTDADIILHVTSKL